MKQFSIALNVLLLLAVGYLYYVHFSSSSTGQAKAAALPAAAHKPVSGGHVNIAYVDLDSLNEKIHFIRDKRKELESEQKAIETEWENGYRNLENQKNNFLKKGNAITQQEAEVFQESLLRQQQQVDGRKQSANQKLGEKSYKFMDDMQKQLKAFLNEYNADRNYQYILTTGTGLDYLVYKDSSMNITDDVVNGMNEKMKKEKKD
ncbi:MAG: OmpH family outer membrane protein [Ferruginibacter sp.]